MVISWNRVNMERSGSPKSSWACSSSLNSSRRPTSSVAAMPKMYKIINAITAVHTRGLADCTRPWISIHSSLNCGISRTVRTMRTRRRARKTVRIRREPPTSTPMGSKIHLGSTPVPKTRNVSAAFGSSKTQTQPKARIRRHHSRKKIATKKCSMASNTPFAASSGHEASRPMSTQLKRISMAMNISNLMLLTNRKDSAYLFW
mmetsp:Transcript_34835/g.105246  ORF Transcript_34835/g.105246 Transcript_34835/m.105246 type:complete len:203 (-) Transcript_34835:310-918(-)